MITIESRYPMQGMVFVSLSQIDYSEAVHDAKANPRIVYLIELHEPAAFAASLPIDWRPPTQGSPFSGIPANVWTGTVFRPEKASDWAGFRKFVRLSERLLDVRARIRWVATERLSKQDMTNMESELLHLLSSWRCTNCGRRGVYRRPKLCPHANVLCGDAKLEPQIHWFIDSSDSNWWRTSSWFANGARELGVVLYPEIPEVQGVTV